MDLWALKNPNLESAEPKASKFVYDATVIQPKILEEFHAIPIPLD